jgi:hypothetical protein
MVLLVMGRVQGNGLGRNTVATSRAASYPITIATLESDKKSCVQRYEVYREYYIMIHTISLFVVAG